MSRFQIGEIAIIARSALPEYPVGMEVTILEFMGHGAEGTVYVVDRPHPFVVITADEKSLRKKDPPQDREPLGEWDLCPWRPGRERVYDGGVHDAFIKARSYTMERFVGA